MCVEAFALLPNVRAPANNDATGRAGYVPMPDSLQRKAAEGGAGQHRRVLVAHGRRAQRRGSGEAGLHRHEQMPLAE